MKRILFIFLAVIAAYSCSIYDDEWIREELQKQEDAVSRLESRCGILNKNISAIKSILASLHNKDNVSHISTITEGGLIVGYELIYESGKTITLYIGTDGKDGQNGEQGKDGTDGKDGSDAKNPSVSVRQDTDGTWYWTVDGHWCLDDNGNKIPAISNDDVTPELKTDSGYWYISYDGGTSWDKLGCADGTDGDLIFSGIDSDDHFLYITLSDGSVLKLSKTQDLRIEIGEVSSDIKPSSTFSVAYRIYGSSGNAEVTCLSEHGWIANAEAVNETSGNIRITAPQTLKAGKVVIFVSEGDVTLMKAITFEGDKDESHFIHSKYDYYEIDGTGGFIDVILTTNQDYQIQIPENAKSWISHVSTKAVREDRVRLGITANPPARPAREAEVSFTGTHGSVKILVSQKASPYIDSEVDLGLIDGFDDPQKGIVILQKATKGSGTDIVIMGDGFVKKHFVEGGRYETIMKQAYQDFFSVEPYASLKEYFNVYYINVLSEDEHDAVPYYGSNGAQNGATQGIADTRLGTRFTPGSTSIEGDNSIVLDYATQAIEFKGSSNGGTCSHSEAYDRAHKALVIVMANVECYAGTCLLSWRSYGNIDYSDLYSIAYCSLGSDNTGRECKYTLIHEAGGHGFGKLSDEYANESLTKFNTSEWNKLRNYHNYGVYRNVNEYWTYEESLWWSGFDWEYTTEDNVYWAELLDEPYDYDLTEGLGLYEGAYTYSNLFCRPTPNSLMNNQLANNGQFFNAISRWAIWYRTMRLTNSISTTDFKSSLSDFIEFDKNLEITRNYAVSNTFSGTNYVEEFRPLGTPVLIESEWQGDHIVPKKSE